MSPLKVLILSPLLFFSWWVKLKVCFVFFHSTNSQFHWSFVLLFASLVYLCPYLCYVLPSKFNQILYLILTTAQPYLSGQGVQEYLFVKDIFIFKKNQKDFLKLSCLCWFINLREHQRAWRIPLPLLRHRGHSWGPSPGRLEDRTGMHQCETWEDSHRHPESCAWWVVRVGSAAGLLQRRMWFGVDWQPG